MLARRALRLALALSLVIHGLALWHWLPQVPLLAPGPEMQLAGGAPLALQLVERPPAPTPPPPPARVPPRPAPPRQRPPVITALPAPEAPAVVIEVPSRQTAPPPPEPPITLAPPPPPPPPIEGDLQAYIAARRQARGDAGESRSAAEEETARRKRNIAANLASISAPNPGNAPKNGGGVFQIQRLGYDDAEFTFYGWNRDVNRRLYQRIEVARGTNSDINIAIVRRIIAIIREHEQTDFVWESRRLGRELTLSARLADNAELEDFMLREFFTEARQLR